MPPSDRHQQPLRLPRDVAADARKQAAKRGISFNAYVLSALEAKLKDDRAAPQPERRRDREAPRGLGLGLRPLRGAEPEPLPDFAAEAPAPVVVNVGTGGAAAGEGALVSGLVTFVMSGGPIFSRDQRRRQAEGILQAQPSADRERLLEQLRQSLSAEEQKQRQSRSLGGSIGSLFQR